MIRIIADSRIPFLEGALEKYARVTYLPAKDIGPRQVRDADALIVRTRTRCDERLLSGSAVKFIATATIGYDHIDTGYCREKGIAWTNAAGCNSGSVKQYVASALARIVAGSGKKFSDLTIGIVGAGHVGSKVERLARLLGMKVLLNDPPRERVEGAGNFVTLVTLLEESDIVSMHVPLNLTGSDKTFHLAGRGFFTVFRRGGWFINTSRGEVADTEELKIVLQAGRLAGTVLDVWENEPLIDAQLLSMSALGTPHIAGYSLDGKANGTAWSVKAVSDFFKMGIRWYPENIPVPLNYRIFIESNHGGMEKLAEKLFLHTYNIEADSASLKLEPENFEKFRDFYPQRREFGAFTLEFENPSDPFAEIFRKIGFSLSNEK
jgi:erythronate-4-phosphate dehydrogenase